MKKVLLLSLITATVMAYTPAAKAEDNLSMRVCEYVQANDKNRLRSFLKKRNVKIRKFYDNIQCNGEDLLVFAAKSKALEVGEFLISKLSAKIVGSKVDAIAAHSAHLAEVAKKRAG